MVKKFPASIDLAASLPNSQVLAIEPYLEPAYSIHISHVISFSPISLLSSHLRLDLRGNLLASDLLINILHILLISLMPSTWPAQLTLHDITIKIFREGSAHC
jgi:hypothetical protein